MVRFRLRLVDDTGLVPRRSRRVSVVQRSATLFRYPVLETPHRRSTRSNKKGKAFYLSLFWCDTKQVCASGGRYRTRPKAQPQGKRSATERYVISLSGIGNAAQTQHKKQQKRKGVLPFLILVRHKASLCQWWTIQDSNL